MLLNKEQILNADDIKTELVDVPEWADGGQVKVKALSGLERDEFEASIVDPRTKSATTNNIRAKLLAVSIVDEDNNLIFSEGDIEALGQKSAKPLDRCFAVAMRLSGLSDKDVDELAKNS